MRRVIAVIDLPPKRAHANTRASYKAAAQRWDAELDWIDQTCQSPVDTLHSRHSPPTHPIRHRRSPLHCVVRHVS
ncbi:MAG: hypothetical protein NTW52_07720 [Planctomycetota bacterium]|nr:hypothetical protein [Planctomycetota bacterium]